MVSKKLPGTKSRKGGDEPGKKGKVSGGGGARRTSLLTLSLAGHAIRRGANKTKTFPDRVYDRATQKLEDKLTGCSTPLIPRLWRGCSITR